MPDIATGSRKKLLSQIVFSVGILLGIVPLISLPMMLLIAGGRQPADMALAGLFNGMTILPASAMAFWKRKLASWWLIADAFVVATVGLDHLSNPATHGSALIMSVLVPGLLGAFGLYSEKSGWPMLLDPNGKLAKIL